MAGEGFSAKRVNLIVNDTGSFYMLNAIMHADRIQRVRYV